MPERPVLGAGRRRPVVIAHGSLLGRDEPDQHPVEAIGGLDAWLVGKLIAGSNITLQVDDDGVITISASGGGGGGAVDSVNGQTGTVVLDAGDVGAVPVSRTITAGAGLVGGGDLSADRTLAQAAAGVAVAVSAVDGTATTFHIIVPSPGAAAAAPIPAGWVDGGAGLLPVSFLPAGVVVVRPGDSTLGESFGLYRIPAGGASSGPWESLPLAIGQVIGVGTFGSTVIAGTHTGAGVEAIGVDTRIDTIEGWDAYDIPYTGTGLLAGLSMVGNNLNQIEGILDRWLFVTAVALTNVDTSSPPPTLAGGSTPAPYSYIWLFGQTNAAENGAWDVAGDGSWTKTPHPNVFDPPGNGYRVTLRSPGSDLDGVTWTWLGDEPGDDKRGGNYDEIPSTTGRWVRFDPVADELAATARNVDAADITSGTVATARLGTGGDGSGTHFLADDQTFKAIGSSEAGIGRVGGLWYSLGGVVNNSATSSPDGVGKFVAHPIYLPAGAYDRVGVMATAAGSATWRFGLYPNATSTGMPDGEPLIADFGTVDMSVTPGLRTATISLTVPTSGIYWAAILVDAHTSTPVVYGWDGNLARVPFLPYAGWVISESSARGQWSRQAPAVATGAMPATFPTANGTDVRVPQIRFRAAA